MLLKSARNGIWWQAEVRGVKLISGKNRTKKACYYHVRFRDWDRLYSGWYSGANIVPNTSKHADNASITIRSKSNYLQGKLLDVPDTLKTLNAFKFASQPHRHWGLLAPALTYGNSRSTVGLLRAGLLLVEAALPAGAVDEAEDKWGDDFVVAWRESVNAAADATALMQCQIMLESAVKSAWMRPAGIKLLCCLPSRAHAMRTATCGAVAVRLWALDSGIRYEKLQIEQFDEEGQEARTTTTGPKGRPQKEKEKPSASSSGRRQQQQAVAAATALANAAAAAASGDEVAQSETGSVASAVPVGRATRGMGRRRR